MIAPDLAGETLDERYELVRQIGHGGFATVYEAVDRSIHKKVAVKVLNPKYAASEEFRRRFVQEARAAARVRHRLLVDVSDQGVTVEGAPYFVMELLQGVSLGDRIRDRPGPMPWRHVVAIAAEVARALEVAHGHGIVHRDVKPGNIYLVEGPAQSDELQIKLLDLGIAKVHRAEVDLDAPETRESQGAPGTPEYMAPEQFHGLGGEVQNGPSIDLYAVGVLMYRLLTGTLPFTAKTPYGVLTKHSTEAPMPPRKRCPEAQIPAQIEAVVLRLLEKHPADRFASARALRSALQELLKTDAQAYVHPQAGGLAQHGLLRVIRSLFKVTIAGVTCMLMTLCTASRAPAGSEAPVARSRAPAPLVVAASPAAAALVVEAEAPVEAPAPPLRPPEPVPDDDDVVMLEDDPPEESAREVGGRVERRKGAKRGAGASSGSGARQVMSEADAQAAIRRRIGALQKKISTKCRADLLMQDIVSFEVIVDRESSSAKARILGTSDDHRECARRLLEEASYVVGGEGTISVVAKVVLS